MKFSNLTSNLLLQWIYIGDFVEENISFLNYQELYVIFKYIIKDKEKICYYLLLKMNEIIKSYNDELLIKGLEDLINSETFHNEIIQLFFSQISIRKNIDKFVKIDLFQSIIKKKQDFFYKTQNNIISDDQELNLLI